MKFQFNTGRAYQPPGHKFPGQVIEVEVQCKGSSSVVKFRDLSRGIDGAFVAYNRDLSQSGLERAVMAHYDANDYQELGYFEYSQGKADKVLAALQEAQAMLVHIAGGGTYNAADYLERTAKFAQVIQAAQS